MTRCLTKKINVGHCDLYFMVQCFCLISRRLFDIWTPYFGIMSRYDQLFDLKINVGHCDLYFMVQWFCLISWRLFDIWTPYFGIMSRYDPMFDLKINVGHCDLYFIVHWFCLISLYLMDECHTFGKWVSVIRSSDLSFFNICSEKHFSFIGKARFRLATLSCNSSYFSCPNFFLIFMVLCMSKIIHPFYKYFPLLLYMLHQHGMIQVSSFQSVHPYICQFVHLSTSTLASALKGRFMTCKSLELQRSH